MEVGQKRTFACALDWSGWYRIGRDDESALSALLDSAPRYARVLADAAVAFQTPTSLADFKVVAHLEGTATTDFGAPDAMPAEDQAALDQQSLDYLQSLLSAYWQAFARTVQAAEGKELRKGPRGGGRDLHALVRHVLDAEQSYLRRLAKSPEKSTPATLDDEIRYIHRQSMDAIAAAARGELPKQGPRGGRIWPGRYYARRSGWHVLDHLWEIEDRSQ